MIFHFLRQNPDGRDNLAYASMESSYLVSALKVGDVGDIFSAHFGPLSTHWGSF